VFRSKAAKRFSKFPVFGNRFFNNRRVWLEGCQTLAGKGPEIKTHCNCQYRNKALSSELLKKWQDRQVRHII
jgi:hypothetical protein